MPYFFNNRLKNLSHGKVNEEYIPSPVGRWRGEEGNNTPSLFRKCFLLSTGFTIAFGQVLYRCINNDLTCQI